MIEPNLGSLAWPMGAEYLTELSDICRNDINQNYQPGEEWVLVFNPAEACGWCKKFTRRRNCCVPQPVLEYVVNVFDCDTDLPLEDGTIEFVNTIDGSSQTFNIIAGTVTIPSIDTGTYEVTIIVAWYVTLNTVVTIVNGVLTRVFCMNAV